MPSPAQPPPVASGPGVTYQSGSVDSRVVVAVASWTGRWKGEEPVRLAPLAGGGVVVWAANQHGAALALDPDGRLEAPVELVFHKSDLDKLRPLASGNMARLLVLDESGHCHAETLRFPAKGFPSTTRVSLAAAPPAEAFASPLLQCVQAAVKISADRAAGRTPDLALRSFGVDSALMQRAMQSFEVMGKGEAPVPVQIEGGNSGPITLSAPGLNLWVALMPLRREAPLEAPDWVQRFLSAALL